MARSIFESDAADLAPLGPWAAALLFGFFLLVFYAAAVLAPRDPAPDLAEELRPVVLPVCEPVLMAEQQGRVSTWAH